MLGSRRKMEEGMEEGEINCQGQLPPAGQYLHWKNMVWKKVPQSEERVRSTSNKYMHCLLSKV